MTYWWTLPRSSSSCDGARRRRAALEVLPAGVLGHWPEASLSVRRHARRRGFLIGRRSRLLRLRRRGTSRRSRPSASDAGRPRLVEDRPARPVHGLRNRDVGRDAELHGEPDRALDVGDVEVDLGVRTVEHEAQLRPGQREQTEGLDADLQVLDARDVHARDEEDVVGLFEQREHDVVEVRGHVDDDEGAHRAQHADDAEHLLGRDRVGGRRLDRCRQHAQAGRRVGREEAVHQRDVGLVDRGRGVGRRVRRRDAEQHGDVAELKVAVDDHDLLRGTRRERHREVRREDALADTTLGGEGDDDAAELDRAAARLRCAS